MASSTRRVSSWDTLPFPLTTADTVATETHASRATSRMVYEMAFLADSDSTSSIWSPADDGRSDITPIIPFGTTVSAGLIVSNTAAVDTLSLTTPKWL